MALWQAHKYLLGRLLDPNVHEGMRFRSHPDSNHVGRLLFIGGMSDFAAMTFMKRCLRLGDGFVDGGAGDG